MTRAFISYSLADKDRFVVSRLISALQQNGMMVSSSRDFSSRNMDFTTQKTIDISQLFIGVITDQSQAHERVLQEWQYASQRLIPNILVVEDTLHVENINFDSVIRFNRHGIDAAIQQVQQRIAASRQTQSNDEWIRWVWGGAAVIALLTLLDKD